jgi:hypothetical protein
MEKITTAELNDLFIDAIQRCTYDLINKDDETIEYELFEEFDIGANSFLHEKSLDMLLNDNYINEDIKKLSLKLREMFLSLGEEKRNADSVRNDEEWHDVLKLSDLIRGKKNEFDLRKRGGRCC